MRRIVEAYDRHYAGLHCSQGDKEEGLPLVVKSQRCDCLIRKARKYKIKSKNIERVCGLHKDIRRAKSEYALYVGGVFSPVGRPAEALFHDHQRSSYLTRNCGGSRSRYAHFGKPEHSENKQRVKDNVGDSTYYLCRHGRFHIAVSL